MRKTILTLLASACLLGASAAPKTKAPAHGYPINPVKFNAVTITDDFWHGKLQAARENTIPLAFGKCEETGRYRNFELATTPSDTIKVGGFPFDDTDVYKTIEGAAYLLQTFRDPALEAYIDSVLLIVAAAQEPDGYLYTPRTMNPKHPHSWSGPERWVKVEDLSHEFYNLGHMVEGAVAYYDATGKRNFLDIACKFADCVDRAVGQGEGKLDLVPGHQIAEMALAKLYLTTGEQRYLDLAKYFLDRRGYTSRRDAYSQAHKPVVEQDEAVGHAVRAAYMYSGMADVAALTGDSAYIAAIDRIWDNIVGKKLYLTGGIGATRHGEAFGANYELPNATAYCETCAAIGNVYVNHRLFLLHGDSKYYDVLERTLYNGVLSGMSLNGDAFFYPNPLASDGGYERKPWFGCACCPSNICRFIPSVPGYVYAAKDNDLWVNLFMSNQATVDLGGKKVEVSQESGYPWNGDTRIRIGKNGRGEFTLHVRIPGWVQDAPVPSDLYAYSDGRKPGYRVSVNGEPVEGDLQKGYLTFTRKWKKGDVVELHFDMEPRLVRCHEAVTANEGRLAVERGPIVYCAEAVDNGGRDVQSLLLNSQAGITETRSDKLNGIVELTAQAQALTTGDDGRLHAEDTSITLVPYHTWNNRGAGSMAVWLPDAVGAARAPRTATAASAGKVDLIDSNFDK